MDQVNPGRAVVRKAWWAVMACVACLAVYILGCVMSRPSWSPDSSRIAVLVTSPGSEPNLSAVFTYDVRTGDRRLVDRVSADGLLSGPAWSPDGHWIAYYRIEPSAEPNAPASVAEPNQAGAGPSGPPLLDPSAAVESVLPGVLGDLAKQQLAEKADRGSSS
jgi:Tol biopolymer transport system component